MSTTTKNSTTVRSPARPNRSARPARSPAAVHLARSILHAAFSLSDALGSSLAERLFTSPRRHARPEREQAALARGHRFDVDVSLRAPRWAGRHHRIAAWRWGFGPSVILVHGWEGRGSQLGALVEPLVSAGLGVIAFDAPGHGDSPGRQLYLPDLADCVACVAAAVGPVHAIVAHSFGVAAVLLAHGRAGVAAPRTIALAPNVLIADALSHFGRIVDLAPSSLDSFESRLRARTGVGPDHLDLVTLAGRRRDDLLVVHDRDDREVPFHQAERLADAWPDAELVATTGLGHRRILRDPDVIARVVAFAERDVPRPTSDLIREIDRTLAGDERTRA